MNPAIVICSRLESSRIPAKAFKKVAGVPAIQHILQRVCGHGIPVVVAVPPEQMETYTNALGDYDYHIYGANADSPLHRIANWLKSHPSVTHIVRITHDDIIIDSATMLAMLDLARKDPSIGYISCPWIVEGAGVEVICRENIRHAALHNGPTEYISYFVRGGGMPKPYCATIMPDQSIMRPYRLTMDYPEDWQVLQAVLSKITPFASARMICEYLDHHTELLDINALPKISFYTCAYNAEATIGKTIASVLNCGIENFEYIIVDDASTDNTISTIAQFSRDKRIRLVVNEQNRGLATSSNTAIALSRGRFIMRVDADDVLMPHNFQEGFWDMAKELNEGAVVVYPAYKEIGNTTRPDAIVPGDECHHAGCALMLRSVLNEMRFRDGIRHWDGLELLNRVSKKHGAVAYYNIPIWYYRVSEKSMSNTDTDTRASMRIELGLNGIEVKK